MKKVYLFAAVIASVFTLISASEWEGPAAPGENLTDNGPYLVTNSVPVNTIVEVVNLENNRTATLIVSAPLDNSKLLALLSKDAAAAIGLSKIGRIRMKEKDDQILYSGSGEREFFSGDSNYTFDLEGLDLALVPAETRPPEDFREPDPGSFIPPIPKDIQTPVITVPIIPVIPEQSPPPPVMPSAATPRFSVRLIEKFDRGSYYIQIGAYEKTQTVESEIAKIDKNLPVAVMETLMKTGNTEKQVYRVLIGPLNFGESGPIFQKYKAIYKDAFLWIGT